MLSPANENDVERLAAYRYQPAVLTNSLDMGKLIFAKSYLIIIREKWISDYPSDLVYISYSFYVRTVSYVDQLTCIS